MHSTLQAPLVREQGAQMCLSSVTDGHAKTHPEKLGEFTPNETKKCKSGGFTCK